MIVQFIYIAICSHNSYDPFVQLVSAHGFRHSHSPARLYADLKWLKFRVLNVRHLSPLLSYTLAIRLIWHLEVIKFTAPTMLKKRQSLSMRCCCLPTFTLP